MPTLYTHQAENVWRTWLLFGAFVGLIALVGWLFAGYYGNPLLFPLAVGIALVSSLASFWFSDRLVIALVGARPLAKRDDPELYRVVENLSITAGLPTPRLYVVPDEAPNAFATGRDARHAAVAVTQGLRELLDDEELAGVIAHELSHIGNRDMLVATVAAVFAGIIVTLVDVFFRTQFFGGRGDDRRGANAFAAVGLIVALLLAPLAATLLRLAISRQREFLADASGALLTRYPDGLARALEKLGTARRPLQHAPAAISHLWIAAPTKAPRRQSALAQLFLTHPPLAERVRRLRALQV